MSRASDDAPVYVFPGCECAVETEEAILASGPDLRVVPRSRERHDDVRWIPKSALHDDSEVFGKGTAGNLVVHAWFVERTRGQREIDPAPPAWWSEKPPRGKEVPTPEVLKNRPLRPPGRR